MSTAAVTVGIACIPCAARVRMIMKSSYACCACCVCRRAGVLPSAALVQFHHNEDLIMRQFMSGMFSREEIFTMACSRGDLADVCWLHNDILGRQVYYRQGGFIAACRDLQMHVAKWWFAQGGIDIHYERDKVFCFVLVRGVP